MPGKGKIGAGLGRSPSALLADGLGTPFGPEGALGNVITGALDIPAIEVSCSIIQVVKRGSARDRRKIKPYKSPLQTEYSRHLSVEDEEILIVISEFLFLEAA
jgi:hypothetical protein